MIWELFDYLCRAWKRKGVMSSAVFVIIVGGAKLGATGLSSVSFIFSAFFIHTRCIDTVSDFLFHEFGIRKGVKFAIRHAFFLRNCFH